MTRDEYHAVVKRVIDFLNGNDADIVGGLEAQMRAASQAMQFEKAAMYRDRCVQCARSCKSRRR